LLDQEMKKVKAAENEKKAHLAKTKNVHSIVEPRFAEVGDPDLLKTLSSAVFKLFS
jgi:hypothetical protein